MAEEKQNQANLVEDENLGGVAGGVIFKTPKGIASYDEDHPWEVFDDKTGDGMKTHFRTKKQAEDYCIRNGLSTKRIYDRETVHKARYAYQKYIESGGDPDKFKNPEWGRI